MGCAHGHAIYDCPDERCRGRENTPDTLAAWLANHPSILRAPEAEGGGTDATGRLCQACNDPATRVVGAFAYCDSCPPLRFGGATPRTPAEPIEEGEGPECKFDVWINVHDGHLIPTGHGAHINEDVARRERCEHPGCAPVHYLPEFVVNERLSAAGRRIAELEAERDTANAKLLGAVLSNSPVAEIIQARAERDAAVKRAEGAERSRAEACGTWSGSEHRAIDWPAFWRSLPPAELLNAAKAMPKVAGPWTPTIDGSGWCRLNAHGVRIAWSSATHVFVGSAVYPDRASTDAALRAADWILVDEETEGTGR